MAIIMNRVKYYIKYSMNEYIKIKKNCLFAK